MENLKVRNLGENKAVINKNKDREEDPGTVDVP